MKRLQKSLARSTIPAERCRSFNEVVGFIWVRKRKLRNCFGRSYEQRKRTDVGDASISPSLQKWGTPPYTYGTVAIKHRRGSKGPICRRVRCVKKAQVYCVLFAVCCCWRCCFRFTCLSCWVTCRRRQEKLAVRPALQLRLKQSIAQPAILNNIPSKPYRRLSFLLFLLQWGSPHS